MIVLKFVYDCGLRLYFLGIRLASPFHAKAAKWVKGRRDWRKEVSSLIISSKGPRYWFHCASLGEFEQARPLMESLKSAQPASRLILTFFSPSGFEIRKDYPLADKVLYLPPDTAGNAKFFLESIRPSAAFFIRYDIWVNHLLQLQKLKVPAFLVSAKLSPKSAFLFSPLAGLYKEVFRSFRWIFCQDDLTFQQVSAFTGNSELSVTGDTRFDRVMALAHDPKPFPQIREFTRGYFTVIVGSAWIAEETMILSIAEKWKDKPIRWIIAPHEIDREKMRTVAKLPGMLLYSEIQNLNATHRMLWIDNIGFLNQMYPCASVAVIGGGFGKGIHNIQEPAVYGLPVLIGPNHLKFMEAGEMIEMGAVQVFEDEQQLEEKLSEFFSRPEEITSRGNAAATYIRSHSGATQRIMEKLQEFRL